MKQGFLSSAAAVTFSFIPMTHVLPEQQLQGWKSDVIAASRSACTGLRKQYEEQIKWFLSPSSAEIEYVAPFPNHAMSEWLTVNVI